MMAVWQEVRRDVCMCEAKIEKRRDPRFKAD